jgi:hypothetical protein
LISTSSAKLRAVLLERRVDNDGAHDVRGDEEFETKQDGATEVPAIRLVRLPEAPCRYPIAQEAPRRDRGPDHDDRDSPCLDDQGDPFGNHIEHHVRSSRRRWSGATNRRDGFDGFVRLHDAERLSLLRLEEVVDRLGTPEHDQATARC